VSRFRQFVRESLEIIPAAAAALARGDLAEFGRQVDASQMGAEEGLGNQVPETIHLARRARSLGAHAASSFGAGFGGSVWAMVERDAVEPFARAWMDDYRREFPSAARRAEYFRSALGPGARRLD
jgi:galactokinase